MPKKMLVLAAAVLGAVVMAVMAVVLDMPGYLAFGATAAFVAIGYVLPFRGLPLLVARRQREPTGVPGVAVIFTVLGIIMSLFCTTAVDGADSSIQAAGWFGVAMMTALGAITVAGLRCAESLRAAQPSGA
ncbi:hypothetical protein OG558_22555 [Kribbella sp. NBC_01510]|uniref:hypothetical protein n=1 Tax=Kribbella sp. NBC_01510 TaxID=2903581 RepID=UPI00386C18EE